jgi:two-component system CheB/CheR fusion protein
VGEDEAPFAVVGLGSSASGLQALSELFAELPADPGMAFVVQHLSPEHRSKLSSIPAGSNLMPVLDVEDGVEVERNKVYVIPPSSFPTIEDGRLHVADQQGESHWVRDRRSSPRWPRSRASRGLGSCSPAR